MSRYIDADKLMVALNEAQNEADKDRYYGLGKAKSILYWQPDADVATVVRCRDCKYYKGEQSNCWLMRAKMQPTDYCSYGERREENER